MLSFNKDKITLTVELFGFSGLSWETFWLFKKQNILKIEIVYYQKAINHYLDGRSEAKTFGVIRIWIQEMVKLFIGFSLFCFIRILIKHSWPIFSFQKFHSFRDVLFEPLVEELKLVVMKIYHFENLDGFIDNTFGILGRWRIGSKKKHTH